MNSDQIEAATPEHECPECSGSGHGGFTSDCCGMAHELGYCAGHCAVPVATACEMCGGCGRLPILPQP